MNKLDPLQVVANEIVQRRFRDFNAGTICKRNLHHPPESGSTPQMLPVLTWLQNLSRDNLLSYVRSARETVDSSSSVTT